MAKLTAHTPEGCNLRQVAGLKIPRHPDTTIVDDADWTPELEAELEADPWVVILERPEPKAETEPEPKATRKKDKAEEI